MQNGRKLRQKSLTCNPPYKHVHAGIFLAMAREKSQEINCFTECKARYRIRAILRTQQQLSLTLVPYEEAKFILHVWWLMENALGYEDNTWFWSISLFKTLRKLYIPEREDFLKYSKHVVKEHVILKKIILLYCYLGSIQMISFVKNSHTNFSCCEHSLSFMPVSPRTPV